MYVDEDDKIVQGAKHGRFIPLRERIASFKNGRWPIQIAQTSRDMAAAGMFYTGDGDKTVCFYCGKGFVEWQPQDNPFEEHAKHFPKCLFLREVKGDEFIRQVQIKNSTFLCGALFRKKKKHTTTNTLGNTADEDDDDKVDKPSYQCSVCFTNEKEILFIPCKHFCTCIECSVDMSKCCICRKKIVNKLRIFMS